MPRKGKGWSVFYRAARQRYVLAWAGKQKHLPRELKNKREAERYAEAWLVEQGFLDGSGVTTGEILEHARTFGKLMPDWIDYRRGRPEKWAAATVADNDGHARNHILPTFAETPLDAVTPRMVADWIVGLRKDRPNNTVRNIYRTFVAFFDWAMAHGYTKADRNPARSVLVMDEVPPPRTVVPSDVELMLPVDHVQALLDSPEVPDPWALRYALGSCEGMRDGEIAGLEIRHVDLEAGVLRVRQAAQLRSAKGHAGIGRTKTQTSIRTLPIHSCVMSALTEWLVDGWCAYVGRDPKPTDPLLPGPSGKPSRPKSAKRLRSDLERLGLPSTVEGHPLEFRHLRTSCLSWMASAGVPDHICRRIAGQAQGSVLGAHYLKPSLDELRDAVERIPLRWSRGGSCAGGTGSDGEAPEGIENVAEAPVAQWIEQRFPKTDTGTAPGASESKSSTPDAPGHTEAHGLIASAGVDPAQERYNGTRFRRLWDLAERSGNVELKTQILARELRDTREALVAEANAEADLLDALDDAAEDCA